MKKIGFTIAAGIFGSALSVAAALSLHASKTRDAYLQFSHDAENTYYLMANADITTSAQNLKALETFYRASDFVEPDEFRIFTANLFSEGVGGYFWWVPNERKNGDTIHFSPLYTTKFPDFIGDINTIFDLDQASERNDIIQKAYYHKTAFNLVTHCIKNTPKEFCIEFYIPVLSKDSLTSIGVLSSIMMVDEWMKLHIDRIARLGLNAKIIQAPNAAAPLSSYNGGFSPPVFVKPLPFTNDQLFLQLTLLNGQHIFSLEMLFLSASGLVLLLGLITTALLTSKLYHYLNREQKAQITRLYMNSLLEKVVIQFPGSLFWKDKDMIYQGCNLNFSRLIGLTDPEEIKGKSVDDMPWDEEEKKRIKAEDREILSTGTIKSGLERVSLEEEGQMRYTETTKAPLFNKEGEAIGLVGIVQDVTERKTTEDELIKYRDHLEELIREKSKDMIKAKEEAELANRLKSDFLTNISHELRTPVHAISGFSKLGMSRLTSWDLDKHQKNYDKIEKSSGRLMALLVDLLDLAQLEAGHMSFHMQQTDMVAIVREISIVLEQQMWEKQITYTIDESYKSLPVECDRNKISQLFLNLLSNAMKFSQAGGAIHIGFTLNPDSIAVFIKDNGIGIPPDEIKTIFDKFTQSSKTQTGAGGSGIGLALCKEIINAHNGTIEACNNPEGGACFTFTLPLSQTK